MLDSGAPAHLAESLQYDPAHALVQSVSVLAGDTIHTWFEGMHCSDPRIKLKLYNVIFTNDHTGGGWSPVLGGVRVGDYASIMRMIMIMIMSPLFELEMPSKCFFEACSDVPSPN